MRANDVDVQSGDHIFVEDSSANIKSTSSIVDNEGRVVFEDVGEIKAAGFTLNMLRAKIKNLMQQVPDSQNAFQIQITKFSSKKALLLPGRSGVVIPITNIPIMLFEVLTQNGLSIDGKSIVRINLQRGKIHMFLPCENCSIINSPRVYLKSGDLITVNILPYKKDKVFILGGVAPQIFQIDPANRETLADVLFTSGGPLSASNAKRSEVYLLRGSNPVVAYHLDAQSPTRLIVADAMELVPMIYFTWQSNQSYL